MKVWKLSSDGKSPSLPGIAAQNNVGQSTVLWRGTFPCLPTDCPHHCKDASTLPYPRPMSWRWNGHGLTASLVSEPRSDTRQSIPCWWRSVDCRCLRAGSRSVTETYQFCCLVVLLFCCLVDTIRLHCREKQLNNKITKQPNDIKRCFYCFLLSQRKALLWNGFWFGFGFSVVG